MITFKIVTHFILMCRYDIMRVETSAVTFSRPTYLLLQSNTHTHTRLHESINHLDTCTYRKHLTRQ